ncbi:nipped-b-like protein, partial [Plakobranchus ocellatus]
VLNIVRFSSFSRKIHRYSPTEAAKVYEKPLNRKTLPIFEPQHTLEILRSVYDEDTRSEEEKRQKLVEDYLEVWFLN